MSVSVAASTVMAASTPERVKLPSRVKVDQWAAGVGFPHDHSGGGPPIAARHAQVQPGLIQKHQLVRVDLTYLLLEGCPGFLNPLLLLCLRIEFFLNCNPNVFSARQIALKLRRRSHS